MSSSRRGQTGRSSRRPENADHEEFLDLLASLSTCRGSARSHSGRHTWRSGLIPPCLEPPHRIQSQFPVPRSTLARVPELNHPDLSRGQRSYLHSIAQIYSLDDTKRSLSNSYYGLLMSELLKGGGRDDSHKRYTGWIYGNHKRLFETNPKIWRSRKLKSPQEDPTDGSLASNRSDTRSSRRRHPSGEKSPVQPTKKSSSPRRREAQQPADKEPPVHSNESKEGAEPEQQRRRLQSARSRNSRSGENARRTRAEDDDQEAAVRVSETGTNGSRGRSAGGRRSRAASAANSNSDKNKNSTTEKYKGGSSDNDDDGDGRRPRDLSSIMY